MSEQEPLRHLADAGGRYLGPQRPAVWKRRRPAAIGEEPVYEERPVTRTVNRRRAVRRIEADRVVVEDREVAETEIVTEARPLVTPDGRPVRDPQGRAMTVAVPVTERVQVGTRPVYGASEIVEWPALPAGAVAVPAPPGDAEKERWNPATGRWQRSGA